MNDIDRFLDDGAVPMFPRLGWDLAVDVYEQKGNVIAKMSLPGVDIQDIDIALDKDTLVISGSRQEEHKTEEKDYFSKEIRRGSFSRIVQLPKSVDTAKTDAEYADGVLTITMPAVKSEKKKPVTVKVNKK
jgi:HSP20 family protein